MVATDPHVATLRAHLAGDTGEVERLTEQLLQSGNMDGLGELIYAAFVTAVRRRFSPTYTRADIIRFVAGVRALLSEEPDAIDPRAAENLIRRALNDQVTDYLDQETKSRAQIALLLALVIDEQLEDAELDEFLDTARTLTGQWWPN